MNDIGVHGQGALMATFANDVDGLFFPVDVFLGQPSAFAGADAGVVEQCEHGAIAQTKHRNFIRLFEQFGDFFSIERTRVCAQQP